MDGAYKGVHFCPKNGQPGYEFVRHIRDSKVGHFGFTFFSFVNMLSFIISFCSHVDERW